MFAYEGIELAFLVVRKIKLFWGVQIKNVSHLGSLGTVPRKQDFSGSGSKVLLEMSLWFIVLGSLILSR